MEGLQIAKKQRSSADAKYSILIPSWNNLDYLKLCIESIRKNSHFKHQLIIHVNEGKDGTLEWIESQPDIDYTFSKENVGICYALNAGRSLIRTDYLVYLNDDMYVCPGWDKAFDIEIQKAGHPYFFFSATGIEPMETGNPCVIVQDFGRDLATFREGQLLEQFAIPAKPDWQGATWPPNIVHIDTWDLVGGYSPEFSPGMYSDPDFSMKLWLAGVRLFKGLGNSRAYHFGSKSTRRIKVNSGYYRFMAKWGISSGSFSKYYLRRGDLFDGPLTEPQVPWQDKLKTRLKKWRMLVEG